MLPRCVFATSLLAAVAFAQNTAGIDFFESRIRPVLAQKCYACHSAKGVAQGRLMLDSKDGLLKGGSRGTAIIPGDPEHSLLVRAISHTDPALSMPPSGRLSDDEIAAFREWIRNGAPDPRTGEAPAPRPGVDFARGRKHWSFQPIKNPALPKVRLSTWPRSPIDRFVLASLERKGLRPAPAAGRRTLLRRVTFDLIGLPPAPQEIAGFVADRSPRAFEKVVDRLLASPHYGERWARHWLDLARYAETSGHEFDSEKPDAWRYRDYVIRAFNEDLPYDQLIREQIAGDLLPQPRLAAGGTRVESPIGSGFFALHEERNAADDLAEVQSEKIDNQIDVLAKTFLGLTVACARCHDHKFDPIPTSDYYSLAGVLHSTRQTEISVDSPAVRQEIDSVHRRIGETNQQAAAILNSVRSRAAKGVGQALLQPPAEWKAMLERAAKEPDHVLHPLAVLSQVSEKPFAERLSELRSKLDSIAGEHSRRNDVVFSDFRSGDYTGWESNGPAFGASPLHTVPPNQALSGWRGAGLANSFGAGSNTLTGLLTSKSFVIDKDYLHVRMAGTPDRTRRREHGALRFTLQVAGRPAFLNADKDGVFEWKTNRLTLQKGLRCYFVIADRAPDGYIAVEKIVFSDSRTPPVLDRPLNRYVRAILSQTGLDSIEALAESYQRAFLEASALPAPAQAADPDAQWLLASLTPAGKFEELRTLLAESDQATLAALVKERAAHEKAFPAPTYGMVSREDHPHDVPVLVRGNLAEPGPVVPRRFLQVLAGESAAPFTQGSGRSELAEAIARPDNPLTSRVIVNRVWQHYFGHGLVRSVDNFGLTGERPTHPELLDHLATRFMASGWSLKAMHRAIVLSSAYRMSSRPWPRAARADPDNRLLHHMPVRRLEAEGIRDSILAVSGALDPATYGPSVPPHISAYQDGRGKPQSGTLDGNGRRSLYIGVRRNFLTPLLLAFDYPLPATTIGRRGASTVPGQALMLMNNEFVAEQARRWAARLIAGTSDPRARIRRMFEEAFARPATLQEIARIEGFVAEQQRLYRNAAEADRERAVWTDVTHVLFNSKEFIFLR
ncbi:MAG: PSD1 and planctomycete cytochrome C domain-containing protein [Bryobacteraceae bacterium]